MEGARVRHGSPEKRNLPPDVGDGGEYLRLRDSFLRHLLGYMKMTEDEHKKISHTFQEMISISRSAMKKMCAQKSGRYVSDHESRLETLVTNLMTKRMYAIAFGIILADQINATKTDLSPVLYRYVTLASVRSAVTTKCIEIEKEWKTEHRRLTLGYDPEKERKLMEYVDLMARKKREIDVKVAEYRSQRDYWEDKASKLIEDWNKKSAVLKEYIDAMKIPQSLKEEWETEFWDMSDQDKQNYNGDLGIYISKKSEHLTAHKKREFYCSTKPDEIIAQLKGRDLHAEISALINYVDNARERFRPQLQESANGGEVEGVKGPSPTTIPFTVSL